MPDTRPIEVTRWPRGVVWAGAVLLFGLSGLLWFLPPLECGDNRLQRDGVTAEATILSVEPTGNLANSNPEVRMRLRVAPVGGEAFDAVATRVVSLVHLPQYQPGARVRVTYMADDRASLRVDAVVAPPWATPAR